LPDLVDKSLVVRQRKAPIAQFRILEPIRLFASEQVGESDVMTRLTSYLTDVGRASRDHKDRPQMESLQELRTYAPSMRDALGWNLHRGHGNQGLGLLVSFDRYWEHAGMRIEYIAWLEKYIDTFPNADASAQATALSLGAMLATSVDSSKSVTMARMAVDIAPTERALDNALLALGAGLKYAGSDEAESLLERAAASLLRTRRRSTTSDSQLSRRLCRYGVATGHSPPR
jgi:hypothetical protein